MIKVSKKILKQEMERISNIRIGFFDFYGKFYPIQPFFIEDIIKDFPFHYEKNLNCFFIFKH